MIKTKDLKIAAIKTPSLSTICDEDIEKEKEIIATYMKNVGEYLKAKRRPVVL